MLGPHEERYARAMGPDFTFNTPLDSCIELGSLIRHLEVDRCIFRSNHASNYLPLAGTLKKDKERLLEAVEYAISDPQHMLRNEWMRGL
jgi:hypothetical protein